MTEPDRQPADTPDAAIGEPVAVAYVYDGKDVTASFFESWTELLGYDMGHHCRTWQVPRIPIRCGTDGLVDSRNKAVDEFLAHRKADWLWWVDTDMGFEPDTVDRLFAAADPVERPIVGGLCFASVEQDSDGFGGWTTIASPTLFDWATDGDKQGFAVRWDYPANTVTRVHGTGSACILIHRSVFERIHEEFGTWYGRSRNPSTGQLISEDLSFCVRANALDIPIYVHTGVRTTHAKPMWLGEAQYWRQRAVSPAPWKPEPRGQAQAVSNG